MTPDTHALSEPFPRLVADDDEVVPVAAGFDLLESWKATEHGGAHAGVGDLSAGRPDVAAADDAAAPDAPDQRDGTNERRRRLGLRTLPAAALLLALIGVASWLGWDRIHADRLTSARVAATRSAVAVATKMADYSYQSLTKDFAAVEQASTPAFAQTFKKQSASLVSVLQKYQAASSGQVSDAAVEKWSTSRAEILVIVSQTVNNSAVSKPSPQENALLLTMVHQHGRWLLDSVSVR